eukprot:1039542_1
MAGMASVQETSVETEGSDHLQAFFNQNSKLKPQWLDKIRQELDYDDLLESEGTDLRNILKNDCALKGLAVTKILNAVRKVPESLMYKSIHSTKVSVVSMKEHKAAQKIKKESARINEAIVDITNLMNKVNENWETTSKMIDDAFDKIINNANKRRQFLLAQSKDLAAHKNNRLSEQKTLFEQKMKELNDTYDETQAMMKDITLNPLKRKHKILSKSKQLLDQKISLNPATNDTIPMRLDVEAINNHIAIAKLSAVGVGYDFWLRYIKQTNLTFTPIVSLNPSFQDFTIIGKIIAVKHLQGTTVTAEAVIVDSTASVTILLEKHQVNWIAKIKKGDCLVCNNAKIEMIGQDSGTAYMRVVVSEKCVNIVGFDWNDDQFENCNNLSEVEYELVKSPEPEDIESSEEDLVTKMISRRMKLYPGD